MYYFNYDSSLDNLTLNSYAAAEGSLCDSLDDFLQEVSGSRSAVCPVGSLESAKKSVADNEIGHPQLTALLTRLIKSENEFLDFFLAL